MWKAQALNNEWKIDKKQKISDKIRCLILNKALNQMQTLCKKYNTLEWLAGLHGKINKQGVVITHIELFEQEVKGSYVELTNQGSEDMSKTKGIIGWIHSHNTMGVFFSQQDIETSMFNDVSIVVNNKTELVGKYRISNKQGLSAFIDLDIEIESMKKDEDIIKASETLVKEYTPTYSYQSQHYPYGKTKFHPDYRPERKLSRYITEDESQILPKYKNGNNIICAYCERNIKRKRLIIVEDTPYHQKCLEKEHEIIDAKEEIESKHLSELTDLCPTCLKESEECICDEPAIQYPRQDDWYA